MTSERWTTPERLTSSTEYQNKCQHSCPPGNQFRLQRIHQRGRLHLLLEGPKTLRSTPLPSTEFASPLKLPPVLGDFNSRVGANQHSLPTCLEHHSTGKINEIGLRLLKMSTYHAL
ncbi:hypothetical protein CHS0354_033675 [Potamilus streckersoni]|uniref:Uncharacterized protein n=1 Tax=Potamilus streckersoni TaxID=2493646 RepID=A0AAE0S1Y7_9BIVA|nr:hypothetical protein CHS0354_033675 [Potamilus streckersoni]